MGKKFLIFLISGILVSTIIIWRINEVKVNNFIKKESIEKDIDDNGNKNNVEEKINTEVKNEETTNANNSNKIDNNVDNKLDSNSVNQLENQNEKNEEKNNNKIDKTVDLSINHREWYFKRNKEHKRPEAYKDMEYLRKYDAYYLGEDSKTIYLTFDEGSDTTYAEKNLDTLKKHNIKATFFVTKPFVERYPNIIKRMVNEGHIVGNHTARHKSMPTLTVDEYLQEIKSVEEAFKKVTNRDLNKYFRYPMGDFSENTLKINKELGYKTLFWSYAFADWDELGQESKEKALNNMLINYHNGAIYLLHGVNKYNSEALEGFIDYMKKQGYTFGVIE